LLQKSRLRIRPPDECAERPIAVFLLEAGNPELMQVNIPEDAEAASR
jgi:hypothetical protein